MTRGSVIWTKTSPVERLLNGTVICVLEALSFGKFRFSAQAYSPPDIFEDSFQKAGLKGRDLKAAFREALEGLSPLPLSEIYILARAESENQIRFVIIRRNRLDAVGQPNVSILSGAIQSFETGRFQRLKRGFVAFSAVLFLGVTSASQIYSISLSKNLETQLLTLQSGNATLLNKLKAAQENETQRTATETFIMAHENRGEPDTHILILEQMAVSTPDIAWWRALNYDISSGYWFDMRAHNASETVTLMTTDPEVGVLQSGGRISVERPGVEAFTLLRPIGTIDQ